LAEPSKLSSRANEYPSIESPPFSSITISLGSSSLRNSVALHQLLLISFAGMPRTSVVNGWNSAASHHAPVPRCASVMNGCSACAAVAAATINKHDGATMARNNEACGLNLSNIERLFCRQGWNTKLQPYPVSLQSVNDRRPVQPWLEADAISKRPRVHAMPPPRQPARSAYWLLRI